MSENSHVPEGWSEVAEGAPAADSGLTAGHLAGLPISERLDHIARAAVEDAIGEAWLFPPIASGGAVTYLFGRHDTDVEGDRGVILTDPLGVVRIEGNVGTVEWTWAPAAEATTEDDAPQPVHRVGSEALRNRPSFERAALTEELYRRSAEAAFAGAEGTSITPEDASRLVSLFAFATPEWLTPFYEEAGVDHLRSLGWDPAVPPAAAPRARSDDIPATISAPLGPDESAIRTTTNAVRAALDNLGLSAAAHSPANGMTDANLPAATDDLDEATASLAALAVPDWVLRTSGLADQGFVSFSVAVADIDGDIHWTGLSEAGGFAVVSPYAEADTVAALVEDALDAAGLGPQGPVVMPLRADHMLLAAAVADEFTATGDAAFTAPVDRLQRLLDDPARDGVVAAVAELASPQIPRLSDGFGLPDYLTIDGGKVSCRPMVQKFVRWIARPRARLTVTLTDYATEPASPRTTGYSFVRSDDGLFVFAVTDPWGPAGIEAERRMDLAAIDTGVLSNMVKGLLGASEPAGEN